jgi:hypoxanthine phosphoribosyltransferase
MALALDVAVNTTMLFTAEAIAARIKVMAAQLDTDYAAMCATTGDGSPLTLLVTLTGAWHFASALSLAMQTPHHVAFVRVHSYVGTQRQTHTPPQLQWVSEPANLQGGKVVIVEDIVDTGHTLACLVTAVQALPTSTLWKTISLLDKPLAREVNIHPDYYGFRVDPTQFVVGFGLDKDNDYRDLPYIIDLNVMEATNLLMTTSMTSTTAPQPSNSATVEKALHDRHGIDEVLSQRELALDPSGYFIIYVDTEAQLICAKFYTTIIDERGLACDPITGKPLPAKTAVKRDEWTLYTGRTAKELCVAVFEQAVTADTACAVTMLNHAAYLGRESMRAEVALATGTTYVQD